MLRIGQYYFAIWNWKKGWAGVKVFEEISYKEASSKRKGMGWKTKGQMMKIWNDEKVLVAR